MFFALENSSGSAAIYLRIPPKMNLRLQLPLAGAGSSGLQATAAFKLA